jgi:hypothetical protein
MSKANALIVGLGSVGRGLGYYSMPGNSHLSALLETKKYQIFGTDKILIQNSSFTYINWKNLIESDLKFDLIVDCGPSDGRLKRLNILNKIFNPEVLLAEKPIELDSENLSLELCNKVRLTYPRRCFDSTKFIKEKISNYSVTSINIKYNNGVFNALSHFFDLLSCWEVDFSKDFVCHNNEEVLIGGKIKISKYRSSLDVFDIVIELANSDKLFYKNFGRTIIDNHGVIHSFKELDYRYRILYSNSNYLDLPTINEDVKNMSILKKLSEFLDD